MSASGERCSADAAVWTRRVRPSPSTPARFGHLPWRRPPPPPVTAAAVHPRGDGHHRGVEVLNRHLEKKPAAGSDEESATLYRDILRATRILAWRRILRRAERADVQQRRRLRGGRERALAQVQQGGRRAPSLLRVVLASPSRDPAAIRHSRAGVDECRWAEASVPEDAMASEELWRMHAAAEVDALVRVEVVGGVVRPSAAGTGAETQLEAARQRAAELEERVWHAAAEAQAWCGVARGNEAVAAGLRATLDALLIHSSAGANAAGGEGFGESDPEDAQPAVSSSTAAKWTCRACGEGEASVLVLPCRHLCLCKACEPRADACPVCAGAKNAAIHIAPN